MTTTINTQPNVQLDRTKWVSLGLIATEARVLEVVTGQARMLAILAAGPIAVRSWIWEITG